MKPFLLVRRQPWYGCDMGFSEAIRACFQSYATFSGRARRAEYWWWTLFATLIGAVAMIIDARAFPTYTELGPVSTLVSLALLLPGLSVTVRRLHDLGRSGWWILIGLVPVVGFLILIYWMTKRGDPAENAHGPNPIADASWT